MINWENEKEKLVHLINELNMSYEDIGRIYGCSGTNIKKQASKLGIVLIQRRKINENEHFNKDKVLKNNKYTYQDICPECGKPKCKTAKLCLDCTNKHKRIIGTFELGYYIGYGENKSKYLTSKCNDIRKDAVRVLSESDIPKECCICHNHEFDDILEVHHIKQILDFDEHTKISEINSLDNLVWVCPNHHKLIHLNKIEINKEK